VDSRALWVKRRLGVMALVAIFVEAMCAEVAAPAQAAPAQASPPPQATASAPAGREAGTKPPAPGVVRADLERWRIIDSQSGPVNYYSVQHDAGRAFLRGAYLPPNKKAVLGFEMPEKSRERMHHLEWSWRAVKLPVQGDECSKGKGDSAAVLYVTWRRFLKWYSLKYVWSTTRPTGTICDRRRNTFVAQDTVVLESGGPTGVWKREALDLTREFRTHFGEGDERADVPPLMGLGVMTDGDQTKTESTGDYSDFVLSP
jgi:hypothetical protein